MTTIVQVAAELIVAVHVPPVPGNDPPLNVNGAERPDGVTVEAAVPPELVIVNVLSVDDPVACVPNGYVPGPSLIPSDAGGALAPVTSRVEAVAIKPLL